MFTLRRRQKQSYFRINSVYHLLKLFLLLFLFLIFSTGQVSAQIILNEFSATTSDDWVEVYNSSTEAVNLSEYILVDSIDGVKQFSACLLLAGGFLAVDWSNRLNNGGDQIKLKKDGVVVDCVAYKEGPACGGKDIDLPELESGQYGVREPEGSGNWVRKSTDTKADNSQCLVYSPTPSPTPPPTLTPTPTPSGVTATYRINEAKDGNGLALSSVMIYVDNQYTHHYASEDLTFGNGRYCDDDKQVACGFGQHAVKLTKSGYQDWQITITLNAGQFLEDIPVLTALAPTSTTAPPLPSPPPSPTPVEELTGEATEEATLSSEIKTDSEDKEKEAEGEVLGSSAKKRDFLPFFFIGGGLVFLAVALVFLKRNSASNLK
ncbi:MAG TPA: lamin tail domain-containing protein [Candidatus Bathyarchaeia archaeon]|nr:lamin tail domain-containing protein [Candidatus Bathyarchaeia archaeon]